MNQKKTADLLRQIGTDYDGVSQELFQTAQLVEQNTRYNLQNKLLSLVRISELSTVKLRDVSSRMVEMDAGMFYDEIVNILGIDVKEYDRWIKIRVPAVLPNRNARDSQAFLVRPLRHALVDFQRRTPIERFGACAICIVHSYDEALGCRRVRDYDNIETKRYLDVIESVFLTNDSGLLCTVLQTTTMSDRDETSFYLMLPETLPIWVKEHIKTRTKIR